MKTNFYKEYISSYDFTDYCCAREVFSLWQSNQAQDIDDYLIRQRKAELNALVKRVIENELKCSDKVLVDLKWNKNYSNDEIAKILEVDLSTVYRRLDRITDILYEKLKYAFEYRFGKKNERAAVLVKKQIPSAVKSSNESSISARIRQLRKSQMLTVEDVSEMTGISQTRLEKLEKGADKITVREVIAVADFFKVSSDYILFGRKRVLRDPLTGLPMDYRC